MREDFIKDVRDVHERGGKQDEVDALVEEAREDSREQDFHRWNTRGEGVVYYIKTCCRIKIGFTANLKRRMEQLSPDLILAVEAGTRDTEQRRHTQFAASRIRGEWFRESPALLAHIKALDVRHHSAATSFSGERFINTASALLWTARERQVLYRWAREGRITRYGTAGQALWDIFELPPHGPEGAAGPPPPKKS